MSEKLSSPDKSFFNYLNGKCLACTERATTVVMAGALRFHLNVPYCGREECKEAVFATFGKNPFGKGSRTDLVGDNY